MYVYMCLYRIFKTLLSSKALAFLEMQTGKAKIINFYFQHYCMECLQDDSCASVSKNSRRKSKCKSHSLYG